jgi:uncharacterized protein
VLASTSRCGARFFFSRAAPCNNESVEAGDLARGIALFNQHEFFEAHEALEDVWRAAPAEQKKFFQGLVQVAVAFHHFSTGNHVGMRSVMKRAMRNLDGCQENLHSINVESLLQSMARWLDALDSGNPVPPLPHIEMHRKRVSN